MGRWSRHEAQGPTPHSPPGTLPAVAAGPDQLARRIALRHRDTAKYISPTLARPSPRFGQVGLGKGFLPSINPPMHRLLRNAKAAERMRRHRARRKRHCRIVAVELGDFEIAGLVRLGLLDERDREDVVAVGDALYRLFDETIATGK
jgi:hypothetical protein